MWDWRERDLPDYARMAYVAHQHRRRYVAYVEAHGLPCQDCGGRGCHGYDSDYGPAEPCGWCETTGKVTRRMRGQWLRCMRDEKRARERKAVS